MSGSLLYGNNRTVGFASSDREVSSFFKGVSYCFIIMKHLFLLGETVVSSLRNSFGMYVNVFS